MSKIKQTLQIGNRNLSIETGEIGRQAAATVIVNMDDTVVLAAVTYSANPTTQNFLPLTVDYQEKAYAAGKFPGGFFKREGRPTEKEVLTCRLIDRSIRPGLPAMYRHEICVNCSVLSYNPEVDSDVPAMIAGFAAARLSGLPVSATLGAVRVGLDASNEPLLFPTVEETHASPLELVMAGSEQGILMVESEAAQLDEETMIGALEAGHGAIQKIIAAIDALDKENARPRQEWAEETLPEELAAKIKAEAAPQFAEAYKLTDKQERQTRLGEIKNELTAKLIGEEPETTTANLFALALKKQESQVVRSQMLEGGKRIDGREPDEVRAISIRTSVLPRTHGSALFTRGETQALVVCTLGTGRDEQKIDALGGEEYDRFIMHYNMPPYATGETGRMLSPKRREIGHGRLAKRALIPALPDLDQFGYSLRVVSEITESNGSSSMASVCGGSLAMMDAGVPLEAPVAGIAMGLIHGDDNDVILSDILGDEDHLGDMDFKVAGTAAGITALQMDIKIDSVSREMLAQALAQAKRGREHILAKMNEELSGARESVSNFAPKIIKIKINVDKIRDVIGKGGATINKLTEETGTKIDIADDGTITISGPSAANCDDARKKIEGLTTEPEVGQIYDGKVTKILEFGAIVSLMSGNDGLLHISQIMKEHVENVRDHLKEGQEVKVKVIQADRGRVRLSMKQVKEEAAPKVESGSD